MHKQPGARSAPQEQEIKGAMGTFPPKAKAVCRMGCEVLFQEISSCLREGGGDGKVCVGGRDGGRVGGLVPDFLAPFHVANTGGPGQPQVSDSWLFSAPL